MPVRPSNSALRVSQMLTTLAGNDGRELSLTELAKVTGMNKTTCQATLLALVQTGFVDRDDIRKTYSLGPAVLALSARSGLHQQALELARHEMAALAEELDVETVATVATDRSIVKVARVLRPAMAGLSLPVGESVPLTPPYGAVHLAWGNDERVAAWLRRGPHAADSGLGRTWRRAVEVVQRRGYSVTVGRTAGEYSQLLEIDHSSRYPVNQISAPVFDDHGRVVLAIGLMEVGPCTADHIEAHAARLLQSAGYITRTIGGATGLP